MEDPLPPRHMFGSVGLLGVCELFGQTITMQLFRQLRLMFVLEFRLLLGVPPPTSATRIWSHGTSVGGP